MIEIRCLKATFSKKSYDFSDWYESYISSDLFYMQSSKSTTQLQRGHGQPFRTVGSCSCNHASWAVGGHIQIQCNLWNLVKGFGKIRYLVFIYDRGVWWVLCKIERGGSSYLVWIQDSEFSRNFGPHPSLPQERGTVTDLTGVMFKTSPFAQEILRWYGRVMRTYLY